MLAAGVPEELVVSVDDDMFILPIA
jgi:hypothetical protein